MKRTLALVGILAMLAGLFSAPSFTHAQVGITPNVSGGGGDTELPAASVLSATGNAIPSAPGAYVYLLCYNTGTSLWDFCAGGLTDTDDGAIAFAQIPGLNISESYVSNLTTWVREEIYLEDAAETAGMQMRMFGTVRRDTAASSAGTTGDNATANTDGLGRLWSRNGGPCADHDRITSAVISESTAATNEIVALSASNIIAVCNYKVVTTAANSLSWAYGTGSDCATGLTAIEGAQPFAATAGVTESGGGAPLFIVPAGKALCLTSSAATAHGGRVSYVKTAAP